MNFGCDKVIGQLGAKLVSIPVSIVRVNIPHDEECVAVDVPGLQRVLWILKYNLNERPKITRNH